MKRAVKVYPGEALWVVYERFYYPQGQMLVKKEYCVVQTEVVEVNEYGWMTLREAAAGGRCYWDKLGTGSLGTLAFRSAQEAARRAQALTDREDRVWGGMGEAPMRRTWERYLREGPAPPEGAQMPLF